MRFVINIELTGFGLLYGGLLMLKSNFSQPVRGGQNQGVIHALHRRGYWREGAVAS